MYTANGLMEEWKIYNNNNNNNNNKTRYTEHHAVQNAARVADAMARSRTRACSSKSLSEALGSRAARVLGFAACLTKQEEEGAEMGVSQETSKKTGSVTNTAASRRLRSRSNRMRHAWTSCSLQWY